MIRITCKADNGKRRAGMHHPKGALDHADGVFTDEQLARIEADPDFSVQILADEVGQASDCSSGEDQGTKLTKADATIDHLMGELDKAQVLMTEVVETNDNLTADLSTTKAEAEDLKAALTTANAAVEDLTTQLDEANATIEDLTAKLAEARKTKAGKKTNKEKGSK